MQRNTEVEENPAFEVDEDGLSLASFSSDPDQIFDEEDLTEHDDTEEDIEIESSPITKNIPLADYFDPADPVSLYFREVNKVPLLTHEEEISLAKRIEAGRKARSTLAEGPVTGKRKGELKRIIEDGWAAREHLITANFRLVISVAKKYLGRGVPFLDLIQDVVVAQTGTLASYGQQRNSITAEATDFQPMPLGGSVRQSHGA